MSFLWRNTHVIHPSTFTVDAQLELSGSVGLTVHSSANKIIPGNALIVILRLGGRRPLSQITTSKRRITKFYFQVCKFLHSLKWYDYRCDNYHTVCDALPVASPPFDFINYQICRTCKLNCPSLLNQSRAPSYTSILGVG